MNQGMVVRWDVSAEGLVLRVWLDDERGKFLASGELTIREIDLAVMAQAVKDASARRRQAVMELDLY